MIRYEDLTLALTADGSRIEVWDSPFGRGASAPFVPPQLDPELDMLLRDVFLSYRDVMRREDPVVEIARDVAILGQRLFASLFPPGPIADLLTRCTTRAKGSEGRLGIRIRLILRWPPHLRYLQALPWEALHFPETDGGRFLSRQLSTTLVRTPQAQGHLSRNPPIEPPLKVLLLLSKPADQERLDLDAEAKKIKASFALVAKRYGIAPPKLKVLQSPLTVDAFEAVLREGFHVVHFAGHGGFDPASGAGNLQFENEQGKARSFDGAALAEYLKLCPTVRLVVLNACWSALPGADGEGAPDLGVGTALAESGVPAVIAMQRPISDPAAIELAGNLYSQLILGDPLELALCHARVRLAELYPQSPSWAIPVLLLGAANGEIVAPPGRPADTSSSLALHVRNVEALIAEKTREFVGRQFLFELVDEKLSENEACILLEAEPGFGKTSFMAELVKRRRHVHHFNRLASADSNRKEHFLANLAAQIILDYKLPYPVLPVEAQRGSSFLLDVCSQASRKLAARGQKLVMVIDALDEVDRRDARKTSNPLDLPEALPDNCAMVLTSRPSREPILSFEGLCRIELDPRSGENYADLEEFIHKALGRGKIPAYCQLFGRSGEELVRQLRERSAGNFMYLRYVLDDLEKGRFRDGRFEDLPQGLTNYYRQQWRRLETQFGAEFFDLALPTLAALTVNRQPVSVDWIAQLIGRPQDRPQIAALLQELRQFLRIEQHPQIPRAKVYQLYHGSFHDFVKNQQEIVEQDMESRLTEYLQAYRRKKKGGTA